MYCSFFILFDKMRRSTCVDSVVNHFHTGVLDAVVNSQAVVGIDGYAVNEGIGVLH